MTRRFGSVLCGKKGRISKDCWWKDPKKDHSAGGGRGAGPKGDGGGKSGRGGKGGKGKGGKKGSQNSLEEEEEPEKELSTLDLCAMDTEPWYRKQWACVNLDTGSAKTVFPMDFKPGKEVAEEGGVTFRTASGELLPAGEGWTCGGEDTKQQKVKLTGVKAPVHKILMSAGDTTDNGNLILLMDQLGYVVHRSSPIARELRKILPKLLKKHQSKGVVDVIKEKGVYNMYLDIHDEDTSTDVIMDEKGKDKKKAWLGDNRYKDLCADDEEEQGSAWYPGGPRRGKRP